MVRFFLLFFFYFSRFNRFFYSLLVISGKKGAKIIFLECFFCLNVSFFEFQSNHSDPNLCVNDNLLFSYHVFLISKPIGKGFDGRG